LKTRPVGDSGFTAKLNLFRHNASGLHYGSKIPNGQTIKFIDTSLRRLREPIDDGSEPVGD
jgi:hypothetical protein